jgi:hypothetical protein
LVRPLGLVGVSRFRRPGSVVAGWAFGGRADGTRGDADEGQVAVSGAGRVADGDDVEGFAARVAGGAPFVLPRGGA